MNQIIQGSAYLVNGRANELERLQQQAMTQYDNTDYYTLHSIYDSDIYDYMLLDI